MRRPWKPGRGYHTAIRNLPWWRNNRDGTITAVVVVWPKEPPAFDGGEWTENELWTVRLPPNPDNPLRAPAWMPDWIGRSRLMPWRRRNGWLQPGPVYMLADKPHRVTWWDEDDPRREVLDRGPVPAKLAARIEADDERMWRRARRPGFYIGPVRVSRFVYDVWRVAFRTRGES